MKRGLRRRFVRAAAFLTALALGGFLVAASGIAPIAASSGHWKVTQWFLQFAKKRSVATHTLGVDAPTLDEPWLVLKGAGHYETGCRPCHGAPDMQVPRIARAMTPPPPHLAPRIADWTTAELFYIVKHGIKFTGMPAWPSQQRDDEVRAMVAFLRKLPELDAIAYRRLVDGDVPPSGAVAEPAEMLARAPAPPAVALSCNRCHGVDGVGRESAAFPRLAGQRRDYVLAALQAYARDERHSGTMQPIAAGLSADQMRELADHYGRPTTAATGGTEPAADTSAIERGREIAARGIPTQDVPSCADCHGPGPDRRNPAYPSLAGQYADYLVLQLDLFASRRRGGSAFAHLMDHVAARLTPDQMRDVARYYASLPSTGDSSGR